MADGAVPETESAILDAALAEVLAHGIRRTTVTDIARRSGVSRQTLYRYWPDAQAVFAALVTRELVAVLPHGRPIDADLDAFVDSLVDIADAVRALPLVEALRTTDPELFARYILERLGTSQLAIHGEIARRIAAGQRAGFIRAGAPDRLAAMVLLIAQSAVQSAPLVASWLSGPAWRRELARAVRGYLAPGEA
jgi:AcrR family transcriptional regulator